MSGGCGETGETAAQLPMYDDESETAEQLVEHWTTFMVSDQLHSVIQSVIVTAKTIAIV